MKECFLKKILEKSQIIVELTFESHLSGLLGKWAAELDRPEGSAGARAALGRLVMGSSLELAGKKEAQWHREYWTCR